MRPDNMQEYTGMSRQVAQEIRRLEGRINKLSFSVFVLTVVTALVWAVR